MVVEKDQKKAYIFALITVFLWSTVATAFKLTLRYTGYSELLLLSVFFSFIAISLIVTIEKKWSLLLKLKKKDIFKAAFLGFLNPFFYYFLIFRAYTVLPAQIAQPLNQIWGIVIVLMSIPLLKQKIGIRSIAGVIISFFGVLILSTGGSFSFGGIKEPLGISFALLSSVVWSLYWILNTKSKKDPVISLFLNFSAGLVITIIYFSIFQEINRIPFKAVAGSLYIGFFEMGVTFLLWLKALKYSVTTAKVSILIYLAPFLSLVLINYVLDEKILFSSLAGLIFIIAGILVNRTDKKAES